MTAYELKAIPNIAIGATTSVPCVACSFNGPNTKIKVPGAPGLARHYYEYVCCPECGTMSLLSSSDDIGSHYPDTYYSFSRNKLSAIKQMIRNVSNSIALFDNTPLAPISARICPFTAFLSLRPLFNGSLGRRYSAGSALLDVGCGDGQKLLDLRNVGFSDLTGIDPYIRNSSSAAGLRLLRGVVDDIDESFDIVTFHHSFEHIATPEQTLSSLHRIVRPDGVAVIRIPLVGGWAWRTFGGEWAQLDAPRHLHLYSRDGFEALANRMGWRTAKTIYDSGWMQFAGSVLNQKGVAQSLQDTQNTITSRQRRDFDKKARILNHAGDGDQATFFLLHS
jgi:SAM-dependent methyltransferase